MSSVHAYLPVLKGIAIARSLINGVAQRCRKAVGVLYWSMSATVPLVNLTTFIAIGTLAYTEYQENRTGWPWKIWVTAAGIMPIGWVWVRKVMLAPSNQLLAIANPTPSEMEPLWNGPHKTLEVLKDFNVQMSFRMMFPWVVGGLALWASLGF
ncbi:hypothetical protein B0H63DRAFT_523605 [Podospora didyma]|uniref:Uncharacterized protein n=1 Tax=Podospora didyma TaxID=330526 RepID=A0AAE0NG59_9PEZI|nr:hypothetical protein B0H63DRAFT_523605 [Podospora didyma]